MSALFDRLRSALQTRYVLDRELAAGGMGIVYLARDTALDRRVALKIVRPELASAAATERFLREARILANLTHPNVIAVHDVGEADGIPYYTMDYIEGQSLMDRLDQAPLSVSATLKLGRDVLDGLEAAHGLGVIHRDIKPSNVLLLHGRAILTDFGIAKPTGDPLSAVTNAPHPIGTPGYMPPEQELTGDVSIRTDLYAVGMVLYEALTGRAWSTMQTHPEKADWTGVPWGIGKVLRRALAWDPADRWSDAARFRRALWRIRVRPYVRRTIALTAAGLLTGAVVMVAVRSGSSGRGGGAPPAGSLWIAVGGFPVRGGGGNPGIGDSLAAALADRLRGFPDFRVTGPRGRERFDTVASVAIGGTVTVVGESLRVELRMENTAAVGGAMPVVLDVRGAARAWPVLADSLAHLTLIELWKAGSPLAASLPVRALPRSTRGVWAWLRAERLLAQGRWGEAHRAYIDAEAADPTCMLCSWRLSEVERWLGLEADPTRTRRYREHVDSFPPNYQPLIRAAEQPVPQRLETLRNATERYREFFLAWFVRGDEQFHRGPLVGRLRSDALESFARATTLRPDFAPAWEHLVWLRTAEGDSTGAVAALQALEALGPPRDSTALKIRTLLSVALAWRFWPEAAAAVATRRALAAPQIADAPDLAAGPRYLMSFEAPRGAVELGGLLTARRDRPDLVRSGLIARAFGYLALGRTDSMRVALTALADRFPDVEARLFGAELEGLLWLADSTAPSRWDAARASLEQEVARRASERAVTLLALLTDREPARDEIKTAALAALVGAARLGRRGDWRGALARSDALVTDTLGPRAAPFFRTALHLLRAHWLERLRDPAGARDELRWAEALDVQNYPTGLPQAGEVDWAFGPIARWRRAGLLERMEQWGDELCACYAGVASAWSGGEDVFASRVPLARARYATLHCGRLQ